MITSPEQLDTSLSLPNDSPQHRSDWNDYISHLDKRGIAGSPQLDKNNLGANLLNTYIKNNPNTTLTLGSPIHVQNDMSNLSPDESSVVNGLHSHATGIKFDPEHITVPQTEIDKFGNWTGQTDTKLMAADLSKRGLVGANQLVNEVQDTSSADAIKKKNQSDWKVGAIEKMVGNARRLGIKTPEAITANWNTLIGDKDLQEAINNDSFKNVHPNFPEVVKGIIKDQWAKYDSSKDTAKK